VGLKAVPRSTEGPAGNDRVARVGFAGRGKSGDCGAFLPQGDRFAKNGLNALLFRRFGWGALPLARDRAYTVVRFPASDNSLD
jgi:hypothetical protein